MIAKTAPLGWIGILFLVLLSIGLVITRKAFDKHLEKYDE